MFALARRRDATYYVELLLHNPLLLLARRDSYALHKQQHVRVGITIVDRPIITRAWSNCKQI